MDKKPELDTLSEMFVVYFNLEGRSIITISAPVDSQQLFITIL
jgi:hypothetical protein